MPGPISDSVESFATLIGPTPEPTLQRMQEKADRTGFPTVGAAVGGWLRFLAQTVNAEHVFEFGSGFGFSAVWFAGALPDHGRIILTERDEKRLEEARGFLNTAGYADKATFELGDALETIEQYDGPFDCVLIDNEKQRYTAAFEAVREKMRPGGLIIADNTVTAGAIEFDALMALVNGDTPKTTDATGGVADYLTTVQAAPEFETVLLPVGEGVGVSRRVD
jgi:predicted O-methyltransferase YrrM